MTRSPFVDPRRCTGLPLLIALLGSVAASPATAAVIYQENFDGSGSTDLAGLVPDVAPGSQTWGGSTAFKADGFVNAGFAGIYLPFTPTPGLIYTLTGSFRVAGGDWLGIGFSSGSPTSTVPEPSTGWLALAGIVCGGCAVWRRLKRA